MKSIKKGSCLSHTHTYAYRDLLAIKQQTCSFAPIRSVMSVSMETVSQTYLRCVETGSLRLKVHQERVKDRRTIMETGWRARGMIEATGSSGLRALIRVGHTAQTSSPWHDIIWWKLSLRMKRRRREAPIINGSQKMVASVLARHVSGARQTRHVCSYTHTHTHNRPKREGQSETQPVSQSRGSRPLHHNVDTIPNPLD